MRLSPRHSEILLLLACSPAGLSGDELAALLYEDGNADSTLRAEMNRLKHLLGDELLASRPYSLLATLAGDWLGDDDTFVESAAGKVRPRVSPYAPGLTGRLWYGGGSRRSIEWAAKNGFNLLIGNLTTGEGTDSYVDAQLRQLELYRAHWNEAVAPRIALGRVIVPTDGANARERERYRAFAEGRHARTLAPQGERRTLFAPDLVGTSDEIVERLLADPVVGQVHELRLELPYDLPFENYRQILEDFITRIAPALGWQPVGGRASAAA